MDPTRNLHDLKCNDASWSAIRDGVKTAEVRFNDRDYQPGDVLILRRMLPKGRFDVDLAAYGGPYTNPAPCQRLNPVTELICNQPESWPGHEDGHHAYVAPPATPDAELEVVDGEPPLLARVLGVFEGGQYGIEEGYVLLSIQRVYLATRQLA